MFFDFIEPPEQIHCLFDLVNADAKTTEAPAKDLRARRYVLAKVYTLWRPEETKNWVFWKFERGEQVTLYEVR